MIFDIVPKPEPIEDEPEAQAPVAPPSPPKRTRQQVLQDIAIVRAAVNRARWAQDPEAWAAERLRDTLWSKQRAIFRAVREHRRVAVRSCHEVSKSHSAGRIAAWWLDIHRPGDAFVMTSAPTAPQVRTILWKEIGRAYVAGQLKGRVNQTEWIMNVNGKEEVVAMGRKPDEYDPTAFQGIHAPRVLVIFDEACGIRGPLWDAADSLIANDHSKFLAIGNPDDPVTEFAEICKPGSGWHVIGIAAFDSPNFTGEPLPEKIKEQLIGRRYVEEKRKKWAPEWYWVDGEGNEATVETGVQCVPPGNVDLADTNPMWQSKVLGQFPKISGVDQLIPLTWILRAQQANLSTVGPIELGVDVGGGGDANDICLRRGDVYRIIREDHDPDTMSQCGKIIEDLRATGATVAKIDKIGIGWGIVNRGQELKQPFVGINVGEGVGDVPPDSPEASDDERFANLKAKLYWDLRTKFEHGQIDIDEKDEDLAAQLCSIRFERTSTGKIKIADKKKNAKGKQIQSPNRAEALMLAAATVPTKHVQGGVLAGKVTW